MITTRLLKRRHWNRVGSRLMDSILQNRMAQKLTMQWKVAYIGVYRDCSMRARLPRARFGVCSTVVK